MAEQIREGYLVAGRWFPNGDSSESVVVPQSGTDGREHTDPHEQPPLGEGWAPGDCLAYPPCVLAPCG